MAMSIAKMMEGSDALQQVQGILMTVAGPPGLMLLEAAIDQRRTIDVLEGGTQIVIPEKMTKGQAIEELQRQVQQDDQKVRIHEEVDAYPLDGAHALMLALQSKYGWANLVPTPGFFGSKNPPTMVGVETGIGQSVQVPWGRMEIPGIEGYLQTGVTAKEERPIFVLAGEVKRKNQAQVAALAELVRRYVRERSIYRGQAVKHKFDDGDWGSPPRFLDISKVQPEELILPAGVMRQIQASIFTPIRRRGALEQVGIRFGRRVLMAGPYGVGKTQSAYLTAKVGVECGTTFIYLENIYNFGRGLEFARQYQPAILFCEDMDRLTKPRQKGDGGEDQGPAPLDINDLSLMLDGITSKGEQVMVVLTTNHPEAIPPILLRCGRSDHLIMMGPPDGEAAERLVRLYARGLLADDIDFTRVREQLAGNNPATIREVVERAMLYALDRGEDPGAMALQAEDLADAYAGMEPHLRLLKGPEAPQEGEVQILAKFPHAPQRNGVHAAEAV